MYRLLSKFSKIAITSTIVAGTFLWSSPTATYALSKPAMDKGLQDEIREELGLPAKENVTINEVAILRSLYIDDIKDINSLYGLEEAYFLTQLFMPETHDQLDITPIASIDSLEFLFIDKKNLNQEAKSVVDQLIHKGITVVDSNDETFNEDNDTDVIEVYIDGEPAAFKVDPVIVNGSTLVQFRPLFEQFGLEVGWDQATRTVSGTKEKLELKLVIDSKSATVSGQTVALPAAPTLIDGNTMVPLRFIGEATGRKVVWDGENRTVNINSTVTSYNFDYLYSNDTKYIGDLKDAVPNGKGRLMYKGEIFFEGDFKNGIIDGSGIMYDMEDIESYYEGGFRNNRFHGNGITVYSDGSYHKGAYSDGMREGKGQLFGADGAELYSGDFSGDAIHGKGTLFYDEPGSYYIGSFVNGYFWGEGKTYDQNQLSYNGEWLAGLRYIGKQYFEGKLDYEGYYAANLAHGNGTVFSESGIKYYRGEMKNGRISGIGMYYLDNEEDGSVYIGEVYEDTMDGYGFIRNPDNTISNLGYWVNDEYVGEAAPPATDESNIKSLLRHAQYSYVDGYYENEYDLNSNEAIMFIELSSEDDVELFNGLSMEAKAKMINGFAQSRWGDVVGVDDCYVYVTYEGDVYAKATIAYEQQDDSVVVKPYPKGNGSI